MKNEGLVHGNWRRAVAELDLLAHIVKGWPESAVNRAYYAAFHAVTAHFALEGATFKSHAAVKAAVHRDLVHTGVWPAELGALFNRLFEMRSTGDYGGDASVAVADAELAAGWARKVVEAVHRLHPEEFPLGRTEEGEQKP